MTNKELASQILEYVGGEENITFLTHCVTRLRFNLKDDSKADIKVLSSLEGVITAQNKSGQLQVVIGAKVNKVFEELEKIVKISNSNEGAQEKKKKKNPINAFLETIAGIFTPILPALIGCGMLKTVAVLLKQYGLIDSMSGVAQVLDMGGDIIFYFMPFFLAVSAAKKFNTSLNMALCLAGAYMYPTILDAAKAVPAGQTATIDFLGLPILLVKYSNTVFPIIMSVYVLSIIYKRIDKVIPEMVRTIFTPMIVLLIMIPLQLIALGPIGSYLGVGIANGIEWLFTTGGIFAAFLLGALRPVLVMFGLHYSIMPIQVQQLAELGNTVLYPSAVFSNLAQAGAALGVFLISKNKKAKSVAGSSGLSGLLGITEPAMYGVNLKYKKPFYAAIIAAGVSSALFFMFKGTAIALGMPGIFALGNLQSNNGLSLLICVAISILLAAGLTMIMGIDEDVEDVEDAKKVSARDSVTSAKENCILSPLKGEVKALSEVNDTVFAQGVMGKGIAIEPTEGKLYAPFNGKVDAIFNTKHAIGLTSDNGVEVLIHIGIDTVNLEGKYFTSHVKQGDTIKANDLLVEFDIEAIKKEDYEVTTPVIVTNHDLYKELNITDKKTIEKNELLIELK
ncbi:PTS beta-glucoside transporter subunit EIIBCA [Clostridium sartagoforme]|uniref:PTS beta-glucoside transporter subunit EIIBCA n=1 Tax=Clostridium sartagoforme TaxID=84031 RepID=A0A4S2DGG8_9CLOT|nr:MULTISPECIES: beta-glucoside-specific PTS transporter subunit IIABC [Clostridium]MBS5939948.1 beta-glucoside-specific PTS transporter subunit IIABC [Clostridium sp.]TGY41159.1 PTS beta-glucoside transporter subunit EIIBCA [Clostridium sartagoforme]